MNVSTKKKIVQDIPLKYHIEYLALNKYHGEKKVDGIITAEELSDLFYKDAGIPLGVNRKHEVRSFLEFLSRFKIIKKMEEGCYTLEENLEKDLYNHLCKNGYDLTYVEFTRGQVAKERYFPKTSTGKRDS